MEDVQTFSDGESLPFILIENKADLLPPNEMNDIASLKGFASANKFIGSFRTSAKTGLNISESMDFLIKNIIKRLSKLNETNSPDLNSISIDPDKHVLNETFRGKKGGGCC